MHEVLVNRLGGLSLPRKSVVRLTGRPDMTLDVYLGRKTTIQPTNQETIDQTPKKDILVVQVDWNAKVGKDAQADWGEVCGPYCNV